MALALSDRLACKPIGAGVVFSPLVVCARGPWHDGASPSRTAGVQINGQRRGERLWMFFVLFNLFMV